MGRLNLIERRVERFLREPPSVRNAAGVIVIATIVVVVVSGVAISLLDDEEYPNVGIGMWWALQTVTTVGYGDVTPTNFSGRRRGGGDARGDGVHRDRDCRDHVDLRGASSTRVRGPCE